MLVPGAAPTHGEPPARQSLVFRADGEPESLAARARAALAVGQASVEEPIETPWNTCDVRIVDPAGHRLVLTAPSRRASPEQRAAMQAMLDAARPKG